MILDLPGYWKSADTRSLRNQKLALSFSKARSFALIFAAAAAIASSQVPKSKVFQWFIVAGFTVALTVEILDLTLQPTKKWYEGRALAESSKTLAWRFAVGGSPFRIEMPPEDAEGLLLSRIDGLPGEAWNEISTPAEDAIITETMRQLRRQDFTDRKSRYLQERILDQQQWYTEKANDYRTRSIRWSALLVTTEVLALVWSIVCTLHPSLLNGTGLLTTCLSCGASWVSTKQFTNLQTAYSTAAKELSLIFLKLEQASEEEWADLVDDAEEAISREHTLWLASRTGQTAATTL